MGRGSCETASPPPPSARLRLPLHSSESRAPYISPFLLPSRDLVLDVLQCGGRNKGPPPQLEIQKKNPTCNIRDKTKGLLIQPRFHMYILHGCFLTCAIFLVAQSRVSAVHQPLQSGQQQRLPLSNEKVPRFGMRIGFLPHLSNTSPYPPVRNSPSTCFDGLSPGSRTGWKGSSVVTSTETTLDSVRCEDGQIPLGQTANNPILVACADMSVASNMPTSVPKQFNIHMLNQISQVSDDDLTLSTPVP